MIIADEQMAKLKEEFEQTPLTQGLDSETKQLCTVALINWTLTGKLTDQDPLDCMSPVLREYVISVQDLLPLVMLDPNDDHGQRWRMVAPLLAGSVNDELEQRRCEAIIDWMWAGLTNHTFGPTLSGPSLSLWEKMLEQRSIDSADEVFYFHKKNSASSITSFFPYSWAAKDIQKALLFFANKNYPMSAINAVQALYELNCLCELTDPATLLEELVNIEQD